ncbi:MAG: orotidine-5'-phosphate decarboxylase [Sphingomonadales bacterium]
MQTDLPKIFCAIDTPDLNRAKDLGKILKGHVDGLKLGLEFFSSVGFDGLNEMTEIGLPLFIDLKLHDIPNTVYHTVKALCRFNPHMLTIHTQGGPAMLNAANDASLEYSHEKGIQRPLLLGVTILTSLVDQDLKAVGVENSISDQVQKLGRLALNCGFDGLVCSPHEVKALRKNLSSMYLVVPGIRPEGSAVDDQKRVMTPKEAKDAGADTLVIGRPITGAQDPAAAAQAIAQSLAEH